MFSYNPFRVRPRVETQSGDLDIAPLVSDHFVTVDSAASDQNQSAYSNKAHSVSSIAQSISGDGPFERRPHIAIARQCTGRAEETRSSKMDCVTFFKAPNESGSGGPGKVAVTSVQPGPRSGVVDSRARPSLGVRLRCTPLALVHHLAPRCP